MSIVMAGVILLGAGRIIPSRLGLWFGWMEMGGEAFFFIGWARFIGFLSGC